MVDVPSGYQKGIVSVMFPDPCLTTGKATCLWFPGGANQGIVFKIRLI